MYCIHLVVVGLQAAIFRKQAFRFWNHVAKQREAVEQVRVRAIAKRAGFGACTVAPALRVRAIPT